MKATSKIICSLLAIIAVTLILGTATVGMANDANADNSQMNDSPFTVTGFDGEGVKKTETSEKLSDAVTKAEGFIALDYTDVTITATATVTVNNEQVTIPENVNLVINSGMTITLSGRTTINVGETTTMDVNGTLKLSGAQLTLFDKRSIDAEIGSIVVNDNSYNLISYTQKSVGTVKWIGRNAQIEPLNGTTVTVKTVGDPVSGHGFGTVIAIGNATNVTLACNISNLIVDECSSLTVASIDGINFENLFVRDKGLLKVGNETLIGTGALEGDALVNGRHDDSEGLTIEFPGEMRIAESTSITLDDTKIGYKIGTLAVDGTLVLKKTIYVESKVDISGNLVLADRDYLCPMEEQSEIVVELGELGLITLKDKNKWYGYGGALEPAQPSDVSLKIIRNGDYAEYVFEIKGFAYINLVDEYSIFDLRDIDEINVTTGFVLVNGYIQLDEDTYFYVSTSSTLAFTCNGHLKIGDKIYVGLISENAKLTVLSCKLTKDMLREIKILIGNDDYFSRFQELGIDTGLVIAKNNGADEFNINAFGKASTSDNTDGITIRENVKFVANGEFIVTNGGKVKILDEGNFEIEGALRIESSSFDNNGKMNVKGTTEITGQESVYIPYYDYKGEPYKMIGDENSVFTIEGTGSMIFFSTVKNNFIVIADKNEGDRVSLNYDKSFKLSSTFMLVGYSYVKMDKEKEFLGITDDDLATLNRILGESASGTFHSSGTLTDSTGKYFLVAEGSANFHGPFTRYYSGDDWMVGYPGDDAHFILTFSNTELIITPYEMSQEVLDELIAKDNNTPYRNVLFARSYELKGYGSIEHFTVEHNMSLKFEDEPTMAIDVTAFGDVYRDDNYFIGRGAEYDLETVESSVGFTCSDATSLSVTIRGHVTLTGTFQVKNPENHLHVFTPKSETGDTLFTVKGEVKILKNWFVIDNERCAIRNTEGSKLIIEGKNYIGDENAMMTVHDGGYVDWTMNNNDGMDIHSVGNVTVNSGQTLDITEKDRLTISDSEDGSFTVNGIFVVDKQESFVMDKGIARIEHTATVTIGGVTIFGNVNEALMTIGDTAHVIFTLGSNKEFSIKAIGDSGGEKIGNGDSVTLNGGKSLTIGEKDNLTIVDAYFFVDRNATLNVEKSNNISIGTAKTSADDDSVLPGIIGYGGAQGSCSTIVVKGLVEFDTFDGNGKQTGFGASGGIKITTKEFVDTKGKASADETKYGYGNKAILAGNVVRSTECTIAAGNVVETVVNPTVATESSLTLDNSITVSGELVIKSQNTTMKLEGGFKTANDGKITLFGNSVTVLTISDKIIIGTVGGNNGYFVLGNDAVVTAKTTKTGGFDAALTGGEATLVKDFHIDVNDSITIMSGAKLTLNGIVDIDGTLVINGGTLISSDSTYIGIDVLQGSWKASNGASVEIGGKKLFGMDGILTVTSTGAVSFSLDANGMTIMALEGETKVNEGKEFYVTSAMLYFKEIAMLSVERNATLKIDNGSENISAEHFAYISLAIDARLVEDTKEIMGPNGTIFKISGEDGRLLIILTKEVFQLHTGVGLQLKDGEGSGQDDIKGVTVEVMTDYNFNSIKPVDVDPHSTLVIGEDVRVTVSGAKFFIRGTLEVVNNTKFKVDTPMRFIPGSTFIYNGTEYIGQSGLNVDSNEVRVSVDDHNNVKVLVDGQVCIERGTEININESFKLDLSGKDAYFLVRGTFIVDVHYIVFGNTKMMFYPDSEFTMIMEDGTVYDMIGKNGILSLSIPSEGSIGYLMMQHNANTTGFDIRLTYDVVVSIKKEFTLREVDKMEIGALSKLFVDANLYVNSKVLKVEGTLWIGKGDIYLSDESTIELLPGSTFKDGAVVLVGDNDKEFAHVTMIGGDGIFITYNGKGWNHVIRSDISINYIESGYKLNAEDTFVVEKNVMVFGILTIPSTSQVTMKPGSKTIVLPTPTAKPELHAAIITEDEGIIIANHSDALFEIFKKDTRVEFTHKDGGVDIEVVQGTLMISKDLTMSKSSTITVQSGSEVSVSKNKTLNFAGKLTLNGGKFNVSGEANLGGDIFIASGSKLVYHDTLIVGYSNDAWISINPTDTADGFISLIRSDMRLVCNGLVTVNEKMVIPDGYTLYLDECQLEINGTVVYLGEFLIGINSDSSIGFFVGTRLSERAATEEHVIIGTDDDNADYSVSGVRSSTSKLYVSTESEYGIHGRYIMSGDDEHFTLSVNKPYTIDPMETFVIEKDAKLVFKEDLKIEGLMIISGVLSLNEGVDVAENGNMHISFGATIFSGDEEIVGYDHDGNPHSAIIELGDVTTSVDIVGTADGTDTTMKGRTIINENKTLSLSENCKLTVAGELDVNGELVVGNTEGMKAIPFEPYIPTAVIMFGEKSTFTGSIYGTVEFGGYLNSGTMAGIKGDVKLVSDIVINGDFGIDGNLILDGHSIAGMSNSAYVKGAIVLDGANSHQLDFFDGTIRVHQYYDGPMLYLANGKINDKWNVEIDVIYGPGITEKQIPFFTKDNRFDGFALVNVTVGELQKATLKIVDGQGTVVQISDGIWQVYSSGFDVKCELTIEEVAAPSGFSNGEIVLIALVLIILLLLAYYVYRQTKGKTTTSAEQHKETKQCGQPVQQTQPVCADTTVEKGETPTQTVGVDTTLEKNDKPQQ